MRNLPEPLADALASGATTLCWCWRVTPRSGVPLGFTDHDRDLNFDGTQFEAASGFTASELRTTVGLAVDNLEVESALTSGRLSEEALAAGDFDDAAVEIFRVDWTNVEARLLVRRGSLGEIRRSGSAFAAEIRGLAHYLGQEQGRVYQATCDAELGDQRCRVDLEDPAFRAAASVLVAESDRRFGTDGLAAFADGWFTRGLLRFTSGANAGRAVEVKRHVLEPARALVELWQAPGAPIAAGDTFVVTAGCDKRIATCSTRFANAGNFRGFPHMPGNDFLAAPRRT